MDIAETIGILGELLRDRDIATLALAAILSDTAFFSNICDRTFHFMDILTKHAKYSDVVSVLRRRKARDLPEILAVLKALQRMIIRRIEDRIFVVTHVGSYESQVANILMQLGADVVFVVSKKKEEGRTFYRIIGRSRDVSIEETLRTVAEKYGGSYGVLMGHVGGAQIPSSMHLDRLKKIILEIAARKV